VPLFEVSMSEKARTGAKSSSAMAGGGGAMVTAIQGREGAAVTLYASAL